jgi:RNA polymerase sigma factor (sigma-70 family)
MILYQPAVRSSTPRLVRPDCIDCRWMHPMTVVSISAGRRSVAKQQRHGLEEVSDHVPAHGGTTRMADEDDGKRFARIVLPHLEDAFSLARWITGNRSDAEDIVQEASLRAFRSIRGITGDNPRAWMLTIVRNTAYTWLRKNRRLTLVDAETLEVVELAQALPGDVNAETPETALIAKADAAELEGAIAAIAAPLRETLVLRDIQGLSYREIAQVTGVPIGTVMSRLARGRGQIIAKLGRRAP